MCHTISILVKEREGNVFIVNGSLEISPLMEVSTGNVTCTAEISSRDVTTGGKVVPTDVHKAQLLV